MKGCYGKYLDVNLSEERIKEYIIPEEWMEKYLGGRGIGARILLKELEKGADPLGPQNILIFATGPLQGTLVPGAGRHVLVTKSPKTGAVSDSYVGGFVGNELGTSGYDGIILRGKADAPKYLTLITGKAELRDAEDLWGKGVADVEEELKERHEGVNVAAIGPGGENLVKFACVIHDRNRAAGRPGFGAVMGSKKLKAIAVKGGLDKPVADEEKLNTLRKSFATKLQDIGRVGWGRLGTTGTLAALDELGILPTKNFQEGTFAAAEKISGERMFTTITQERDTCAGCPVRCKRVVKTEFLGETVEERYGGPEYETLAALGSLCMNENLDAIALANQKCNEYSLDTISTGVTIAFAMEASEKGLLDIDLEWGDAEGLVNVVDKIAHREGIGDRLADGIDKVAKEIGADFDMQVKGQEIPMHEPRGKKALAVSYAASPRGANHMELLHDVFKEHPEEFKDLGLAEPVDQYRLETKPKYVHVYENLTSFCNSMVMCAFTSWDAYLSGSENVSPFPMIREIVNATTGLGIDKNEMLTIGERNFNLLKIHAAREGITRKQDGLPRRFSHALSRGASAGHKVPEKQLKKTIKEYYQVRGWNKRGPTKARLRELDMDNLIGKF